MDANELKVQRRSPTIEDLTKFSNMHKNYDAYPPSGLVDVIYGAKLIKARFIYTDSDSGRPQTGGYWVDEAGQELSGCHLFRDPNEKEVIPTRQVTAEDKTKAEECRQYNERLGLLDKLSIDDWLEVLSLLFSRERQMEEQAAKENTAIKILATKPHNKEQRLYDALQALEEYQKYVRLEQAHICRGRLRGWPESLCSNHMSGDEVIRILFSNSMKEEFDAIRHRFRQVDAYRDELDKMLNEDDSDSISKSKIVDMLQRIR